MPKTKKIARKKPQTPNHLIDTYIDFDKSVDVARVESQWQNIVVVDYAGHRFLHIDSVAIQSAMSFHAPHVIVLEAIQYLMGMVLFYNKDPKRCLIAGVGGGSLIRFLRHHYPTIEIHCIDMDAAMFTVAQEYFGLPVEEKLTRYIVDDAFVAIERLAKNIDSCDSYDSLIVNIDYGDTMPRQFFTKVFYQRCRSLLSLDGILVLNFIVDDAQILTDVLKAIRSVFKGRCVCIEVPGHYNVVVYAFKSQPLNDLSFRAMKLKADECQACFEIDLPAIWQAIRTTTPSISADGQKNRLSHLIP